MNATEKATELGTTGVSRGINWTWADFDSEQSANEFNDWCESHGYETRGVYPPRKGEKLWGVRFR